MVQLTSVSQILGEHLVREKGVHDLSRNPEFARFQFLGFRTSPASVDLVAFCDGDGLTESDIVRRRDEFFDLVRSVPREYGLRPCGRNPNGLLAFAFADGCREHIARFIGGQTRISHAVETGGVSVAWAVDVRNQRIHTHDNPVSLFPPVVIPAQTVYPGLHYLQSLLHRMPDLPSAPSAEHDLPEEGARAEAASTPPPEKVRILFLAANPGSRLDLEREFERIETSLRLAKVRERLELKQVWAACIDRVMQAMLDEAPTIVHFSGHGEQRGIILRTEGDAGQLISAEALASLFELFRETVQCVVLNACWSEPQAQAIGRHVPHVIGTRDVVPDETAVAFSTGFYRAIAAGKDVPFAFRMGVARVQAEGRGGEDLFVLL